MQKQKRLEGQENFVNKNVWATPVLIMASELVICDMICETVK